MFSYLSNRFGVPGVIAVIALVFAMVGGAYAANNGGALVSGKKSSKGVTKKEVETIAKREAKKFSGAGPAGPQGPKGDAGSKGDTGSQGLEGKQGTQGIQGKPGEEGSPWTAGGTLPEGSTETGTWSDGVNVPASSLGVMRIPVSIPIPTSGAPAAVFVKPGEDKTAEGCPGIVGGVPTADEGTLCVYAQELTSNIPFTPEFFDPLGGVGNASAIGTVVSINCLEGLCVAYGSWAVTG